MSNLRQGTYGNYYGSYYTESVPLTDAQAQTNATYIYSYLTNKGWSLNAIAGMLGNIQAESSMNPGRWQSDSIGNTENGYGLVQWTPAQKYLTWCSENNLSDPSEMDNNLSRIIYEVENSVQWIATDSYSFSFKDFTTSSLTVSELARAFLLCYERPADQSEEIQRYRASLSESWYTYLSGQTPTQPTTPTSRKKRKYNFLLMRARMRREEWTRQLYQQE